MNKTYDENKLIEERYRYTLSLWSSRAHRSSQAHYIASERCIVWGNRITVLNAIFSIMVLFIANAYWIRVNVDEIGKEWHLIAVSVASLFMVLLQVVQYLYRFEERASIHKNAGVQFANLLRKIERYLCDAGETMGALHNINRAYNQITSSHPIVPRKIWTGSALEALAQEIARKENELRRECLNSSLQKEEDTENQSEEIKVDD